MSQFLIVSICLLTIFILCFSIDKHHSVNANKSNTCETCASSKLVSCVCKLRALCNNQSSHIEPRLQNSIETTPLADLPGIFDDKCLITICSETEETII